MDAQRRKYDGTGEEDKILRAGEMSGWIYFVFTSGCQLNKTKGSIFVLMRNAVSHRQLVFLLGFIL